MTLLFPEYSNVKIVRPALPAASMKATLYEALGIPPAAPHDEVRAALRRLIRKYYTKTRDGQGNVEEALRFINHASRILGDPDRRLRYDKELGATTDANTEQRINNFVSDVAAEEAQGSASRDEGALALEAEVDDDAEEVKPELSLHHPGLTERMTSFGRSWLGQLALCAVFGAFILGAIFLVTPTDAVLVAKQVLVWLTLSLIGLSAIYGAVHGLAWLARRHHAVPAAPLAPQTDLAILNWRREKSVFMGTHQPAEDASWIFQLRMAELDRAKAGRTSEPRPWNRLAARLFDYAIWGLVLALALSQLRSLDLISDDATYWMGHPLLAPILITATWIPIEALLIAALQTTPGKWLFGVYLQFSISNAYAPRTLQAQLKRGLARAFRVWWQGVGFGFPLIAPFVISMAYERLAQNQETDWDGAEDCLVTHGPPGILNTVTGVVGLAAMLWLYGVAWHEPMADTVQWTRSAFKDWLPATSAIIARGLPMDAGKIGILPSADALTAKSASATSNAPFVDSMAPVFEERKERLARLKSEGPRMLRAGSWRRAVALCRAWTEIEFWNPEPWRCLGQALQAQGFHQDAIAALKRAKNYAPDDPSIDAAIDRSQKGIVADFISRYRR